MPRAKDPQKEMERRKKISESCKAHGVGKWMLGRKMSDSNKQKLHETNLGNKWNVGKKQSEETKKRRSRSLKMMGHKPPHFSGEESSHWKGGNIELVCKVCEKKFEVIQSRKNKAEYCSHSCSSKRRTGKKSSNWKSGISKDRRHYDRIYRNSKLNAEGSHTKEQWEELKKKFGFMCLCCKNFEPEIELTEDHIIPLSKGGTDFIENIQPLCRKCNSIKHTKTTNFIRSEFIML